MKSGRSLAKQAVAQPLIVDGQWLCRLCKQAIYKAPEDDRSAYCNRCAQRVLYALACYALGPRR